jgi:thiamine pyrophosphate-dependent acetolactate synthase large subunit-like protein
MAIYRVEMMTRGDYHEYMTGSYNYWIRKVDIEASTAEEAAEIAKNNHPEMVINTDYVRTVAELEEMEAKRLAEREAYWKADEEKKARAKARKAEREKAKAEALGLTVEEYKAKVKHDKKVRDTEARIAALKAELAKEEKYLEELKKGA